ncbi:CaiB/BaiF CoA-transferase family protein [Hydrogenophaga sp.]|uniref:CaiB/BaiF CoA transferase family protein n=1 Tax=Hydrogenophaga sp. TaxID=1904254 RepID=UPI00271A81C8|nr:CaiB/BaiF CoA-transferase family protein [Hydrogenophaga sp.]MDO9434155.1 CaiB/BaiF CoA-transferase family protein [Hydrogenophaga sp.]
MSSAAAPSQGPLRGLTVVEICTTIAGPACARMMADFGADVIKIEPPSGDPVRQMGRHVGDVSLYAAAILRGKKSVALDLKQAQGRELAFELASRADILIENNRPGVLERLGLSYEALSAVNPGLVMVRISGYGQDGPYAERPGYGAICEAVGGVRHMTGDPDRPPARVALATTDYLTATYAAFGAAMAIIERQRTGLGQVVDVALYETAFSQMEPYVPAFEKLGFVPKRVGPNLPTMAPNSLYPTADGSWMLIAANSNPTFERLVNAMGQPQLLCDPRFADIRTRGEAANMKAIDAIVADWTRTQDTVSLAAVLQAAEVPSSPIYTIADIYADPHYAARNMLVKVPHPALGHTTQAGIVPKLSATPGAIRHTGPDIGADTLEVLRGIGLSDAQIQQLEAAKVIRTHA